MARRSKAWFAPKTYGFGAGLPLSWEGWVVLLLFLVGVAAASALLHGLARAAWLAVLVVALVAIAAPRTEGGWRWRWGRRR
jgi:hypothetical protein